MPKERFGDQLLNLLKSEEDTVKIYSEKELFIISRFAEKLQILSEEIGEEEMMWWLRLPAGNPPDGARFNEWKKEFLEMKNENKTPNLDDLLSHGFTFFLGLCDSARVHLNEKK